MLEAENLKQPVCAVCGSAVSFPQQQASVYCDYQAEGQTAGAEWTPMKTGEKRGGIFQAVSWRRAARPGADADLEWGIDVPKARL